MSYELKENDVLRDGVKIATVVNGEIVMEEGYEQYRMAAGNFIRQDSKIARLRDCDGVKGQDGEMTRADQERPGIAEAPEKITTVRQLVTAMQPHIAEPCPAFSPFWGDKTPEVNDWIQDHDDVRRMVLKKHNDQ